MATKKEVKKDMKINAICGVLCISLVGVNYILYE